ncbi:hypothetical protein ACQFX9_28485 [Aliinostoc sp. HNIBRCY26]
MVLAFHPVNVRQYTDFAIAEIYSKSL